MIADVIRETSTEHEVYFLLTAYIEALQFGDRFNLLSKHLTDLPLNAMADLRARSANLLAELDSASKRLDHRACLVINEALAIFGAALNRFELLEEEVLLQNPEIQFQPRRGMLASTIEVNKTV
ncbi:MAG: hypothetical protein ACREUV_08590 [Burkholderiales bacterium]